MSYTCGSNTSDGDSHTSEHTCFDTPVRTKLGIIQPNHAIADFNYHQESNQQLLQLTCFSRTVNQNIFSEHPDNQTWWTFTQAKNQRYRSRKVSRCFTNTTRTSKVERIVDSRISSKTPIHVNLADKSYWYRFHQSRRQNKATTMKQGVRRIFFVIIFAFLYLSLLSLLLGFLRNSSTSLF